LYSREIKLQKSLFETLSIPLKVKDAQELDFPDQEYVAQLAEDIAADTLDKVGILNELKQSGRNIVLYPQKEFQGAFDYLFINLNPLGTLTVQAIEPSYSNSGFDLRDEEVLRERLSKKLRKFTSLDWNCIGFDARKNILQVFIFFTDLPANFDWAGTINLITSQANVIVLDNAALREMYAGLFGIMSLAHFASMEIIHADDNTEEQDQ